jgi:hypothetical protein
MFKNNGPKVLLLDIETSPIIASVWGIWNQDVPLNMIEKDWSVLSYSAKLLGDKKMYYDDVRGQKDINDDSKLLKGIWKLLDEADVIVTQNGKKFDIKKLNARFIINGMQPPSSFKHIDTKQIASKNFAFTSNKLEYMAQKLGLKQQKSKHKKFSGFELWRQCLANNLDAWKEMEHYNKQDVLTLEELYLKLRGWDNQGVNFNVYVDDANPCCGTCGNTKLMKKGYQVSKTGRFQRYICRECGSQFRGRKNLNKNISIVNI